MGHKINPTGIRIGINKGWNSTWYANNNKYADYLLQDIKIREYVSKKLLTAGVESVKVRRSMNKIFIDIKVARPGVVIGRGGAGIEDLKLQLKNMLKEDIELKIFEVKKPEIIAKLIADNIKMQIERRVVPKYACMKEIELAKNSHEVKGIRIWVSGRIKGAEIARTEKFQWGTVPLQTLRANIDYVLVEASVPNAGIHGIKVWVFTGEKFTITDND